MVGASLPVDQNIHGAIIVVVGADALRLPRGPASPVRIGDVSESAVAVVAPHGVRCPMMSFGHTTGIRTDQVSIVIVDHD